MGIAANDFTYWAVSPMVVGQGTSMHNDLFGMYQGVSAAIYTEPRFSFELYYSSPTTNYHNVSTIGYTTPYEVAGSIVTIRVPSVYQDNNTVYTFTRWQDENGVFIPGGNPLATPIESRAYIAVYTIVEYVRYYVKNEFKDPIGSVTNGGDIRIQGEVRNTDQSGYYTEQAIRGNPYTFGAIDQLKTGYWRGFNTRTDHDGGWEVPDPLAPRVYTPEANVAIQNGWYIAHFRNLYSVNVLQPAFVETGGNGGGYKVGSDPSIVQTWTGDVWQYESITIEAVPPPSSNWVFVGWSDGNTQNPRSLIPTDHVNYLSATFKAHLASSNPFASGSNNQRKIAAESDWVGQTVHAVYESVGSIWHTRNRRGAGWEPERQLGIGRDPSIYVHSFGHEDQINVDVVWQSGGAITYRSSNPDNGLTWNAPRILTYTYSNRATPVFNPTRFGVVYAEEALGYPQYAGIYYYKTHPVNTSGVAYMIPGTAGQSTAPAFSSTQVGSQIVYGVAFVRGGRIYYAEFTDPNPTNFNSPPQAYGSVVDLTAPYGWMSNCSNPSITTSGSTVYVTWDGVDQPHAIEDPPETGVGATRRVVFFRERISSVWQPVVEFFHSIHQETNASVGTDVNAIPPLVHVYWECSGHIESASRLLGGGSWVFSDHGPGRAPNLTAFGAPVPWSMHTTGTASPYPISLNSLGGTQSNGGELVRARLEGANHSPMSPISPFIARGGAVRFDSIRIGTLDRGVVQGDFWTESSVFEVERNTGREPLEFTTDTINFEDWLGTTLFSVPTDANRLIGSARIALRGFRIVDPRVSLSTPVLVMSAKVGAASQVARSITLGDIARLGVQDTSIVLSFNLPAQALRGKSVRIRQRLIGQGGLQEPGWSAVVYADSVVGTGPYSPLAKAGPFQEDLPTAFALHANYPNPFNPSTQINYDLPEPANVSLVVYDVLGRRVGELADGHHEAGYHTAIWNATDQASGVYFARFVVTGSGGEVKYSKVNKLVLMK